MATNSIPNPIPEFEIAQEIGVAAIFGLTSGYALKKIGKSVALGVGLCILSLEGLQKLDLITIKWKNVERLTTNWLDQDGDGKITTNDFRVGLNKIVDNITANSAKSSGFLPAFYLGLRFG